MSQSTKNNKRPFTPIEDNGNASDNYIVDKSNNQGLVVIKDIALDVYDVQIDETNDYMQLSQVRECF